MSGYRRDGGAAGHLDEVAKTIIEAAVHRDLTEAPEVAEPRPLSMPIGR